MKKKAKISEKPIADIPAWAMPLQKSLIAALTDEHLPRDARAAISEGVIQFINSYGDMNDADTIKQFFIPAIVNACQQSDEEDEE